MSITIRLSRIGRKNQPAYKLVVSNTRDKRNGRFVDIIGHFNPMETTNTFSYDKEKYEKWAKRGALITEAVKKLIDGKYEFEKYEPRKVAKKEREDGAKSQEKTPVEDVKDEIKEEIVEEKEEVKEEVKKEKDVDKEKEKTEDKKVEEEKSTEDVKEEIKDNKEEVEVKEEAEKKD